MKKNLERAAVSIGISLSRLQRLISIEAPLVIINNEVKILEENLGKFNIQPIPLHDDMVIKDLPEDGPYYSEKEVKELLEKQRHNIVHDELDRDELIKRSDAYRACQPTLKSETIAKVLCLSRIEDLKKIGVKEITDENITSNDGIEGAENLVPPVIPNRITLLRTLSSLQVDGILGYIHQANGADHPIKYSIKSSNKAEK